MSYWDRDRLPRIMRERELEERLVGIYAEYPGVLCVHRQVRMAGNQRADIVVHSDQDGQRLTTVIEIKTSSANTIHLNQLFGYLTHMREITDPETWVHGMLVAPRFSPVLMDAESELNKQSVFLSKEWV